MSDQINTKTPSEISSLIVRSHIYRFIAYPFRRPDSNKTDFKKENMDLPWDEIADALPLRNKARLIGHLKGLSEKLHQTAYKDRVMQYEDCFGYTASGPVPCYELEYGEEHTHREPQQLSDIASFYNAFGLKVKENNFERVDHIAVECEFMHYLLFKEAYALSNAGIENAEVCRQASVRFLGEHLGRWAPSFALKLSRYAKQGFLKDLADLTFLYIVQDCEWLGVTAGPEDLPIRPVQEKEDSGCVSCSLRPETPQ
jgi:TorA maturation chaperone TorD